MPFRPLNDRHAIHEVVFVLTLGQSIPPESVKRVIDSHALWREQLPKMEPLVGHKFRIPMGGDPQAQAEIEGSAIGGVSFEALKRDGSLDWRLRLQDNWISVNCLSYTRWNDIWPVARNLIKEVSNLVIDPQLRVTGIVLEYIDVFVWEGNLDIYRAEDLFDRGSGFFPQSIWDKGPLWHLYQGWYRHDGLPIAGKVLEKVHIDALERQKEYQVRIDTTLRYDLAVPVSSSAELFGDEASNSLIEQVYEELHASDKRILAELLTKHVSERISLNV